MTKEEIFEVWAPPRGRWSRWVKPVLFACMDHVSGGPVVSPEIDSTWLPSVSPDVALVVDLPGADGVWTGLALARRGFCPVPLYNAVPAPTSMIMPVGPHSSIALVDVQPIVAALKYSTSFLQQWNLAFDAPPAFLLDWDRQGLSASAVPGRFDNRSVSFATDFPSATILKMHRIQRVVLIQERKDEPQPDLAHTLRRWQEEGIAIELQLCGSKPSPLDVPRPSRFGRFWYRAQTLLGLRRNPLGGFGGVVPEPSAG